MPGPIAFQPSYQVFAYQAATNPNFEFGWAGILVHEQLGGFQPPVPSFLSGSMCFVDVDYFNIVGDPMVPAAVQWQLVDLPSGMVISDYANVPQPLSFANQIIISSQQNTMVSLSRQYETRQVSFKITDGYANVSISRALYYVIRQPAGDPDVNGV